MTLIHHCTAKTLQLAGPDRLAWRTIDYVTFVGKTEPLETIEILAYKGELSEEQRQMQGFYQQGIDLYRRQQWDETKAAFQALRLFHRASPRSKLGWRLGPHIEVTNLPS